MLLERLTNTKEIKRPSVFRSPIAASISSRLIYTSFHVNAPSVGSRTHRKLLPESRTNVTLYVQTCPLKSRDPALLKCYKMPMVLRSRKSVGPKQSSEAESRSRASRRSTRLRGSLTYEVGIL